MNVFVFALSALVVTVSCLDSSLSTGLDSSSGSQALHQALKQLQSEYIGVKALDVKPKAEEEEMEEALSEASSKDDAPLEVLPEDAKEKKVSALKAQAGDEVVLKNGKEMSHSEFEDAISNLFKVGSLGLSKEELAATPFGKSVQKIRDVIEKDMIPKVLAAHSTDQKELIKLSKELHKCHTTKNMQWKIAKSKDTKYKAWSPKHKSCRQTEGALSSDRTNCWEDEADKRRVMELKCKAYAIVSAKYSNQNANRVIVTKAGSESAESAGRGRSGSEEWKRDESFGV
jgi:hypothetical protein